MVVCRILGKKLRDIKNSDVKLKPTYILGTAMQGEEKRKKNVQKQNLPTEKVCEKKSVQT